MIPPAAALRAQLDDTNKSMNALESQMTSLHVQKKRLLKDKGRLLKDLGSITYPVLTLPNEITVEIFLHFVSVMRQEKYRPQPYYGLLRLASVCQTWRAVTLSTCALWNDIVMLDFGVRDAGELLKFCLPRAGSLPLDLDIRLQVDDSTRDMIISTLSLYSSQWRRVRLSSFNSFLIFPISLFPSSFPLLESFALSDFEVNDDFVSSLRHAPQLRELCLGSSSLSIQLGLPFNNLTKLTFTQFSMAELLAVLSHTLNLECLELLDSTEDAQATPLPILLPHLHTFICMDDSAAMIVQHLTLPGLESLRLELLSDAGVHAIQSCVARSCSTIRTLELIRLTYPVTYNCLRNLSTVRHLSLSWGWSNHEEKQFLAAMISAGYLPALESLTCNACRPESTKGLFAVVSARWRGVQGMTKLISVSLDLDEGGNNLCSFNYPYVLDQLYELGRQGLELKITRD